MESVSTNFSIAITDELSNRTLLHVFVSKKGVHLLFVGQLRGRTSPAIAVKQAPRARLDLSVLTPGEREQMAILLQKVMAAPGNDLRRGAISGKVVGD